MSGGESGGGTEKNEDRGVLRQGVVINWHSYVTRLR